MLGRSFWLQHGTQVDRERTGRESEKFLAQGITCEGPGSGPTDSIARRTIKPHENFGGPCTTAERMCWGQGCREGLGPEGLFIHRREPGFQPKGVGTSLKRGMAVRFVSFRKAASRCAEHNQVLRSLVQSSCG